VRFFWCGSTGELLAEIDGEPAELIDTWVRCGGRPISFSEFTYRATRREWAKQYAPWHPAANPRKPIDLPTLPPRF
jgi:hypothetical protein